MKKILACLIAALLVFSLGACGGKVENENGLKTVKKGILTVALSPDFAPMEFVDKANPDDPFTGFDVSLAKYIAEQIGFELEIKPMGLSDCQNAVKEGRADISISGYVYTEERAKNFGISDYYYPESRNTDQVVIAFADKADQFVKAENFTGVKVGVQDASLQESLAKKHLKDADIKAYSSVGDCVAALRAGEIECIVVTKGNSDAFLANNKDIALTGFVFDLSDDAYNNVILVEKEDKAMLAAVNAALESAYNADLYKAWTKEALEKAKLDTSAEVVYDRDGNPTE